MDSQETIGSSATFIGSLFESAGFYQQSFWLDRLNTGLLISLGSLIYLIAILISIGEFLSSGKAKSLAWLLIGPGLFFSAITLRTEAKGVDWKFGSQQRNTSEVLEIARQTVPSKGVSENYTPRISTMFSWYERLISDVVNNIVNVISLT